MKRIAYILLFFLGTQLLPAQQKKVLQVVWQEHQEEYRFPNEFLLEIDAEKADITIRIVEGNTVSLYLKQSAKNIDVRTAERELKYNHFVAKKERNRLYLHNYAKLEANSKGLSSIINNKYIVEVPKHCHLKIKNELGAIRIDGVRTTTRLNAQYCDVIIENAKGKIYADSRIGDINLKKSYLEGELITENVHIKIQECGGSYDVNAQFGSISCTMSEQLSLFNANLEHCEATFINRTAIEFDYAINTEASHISVLDELLKEKIIKNDTKESLGIKNENAVGTLIIRSSYSDINLY